MLTLAQATERLTPEPADPVELAERLIDFAERAPVFRYRQPIAREALVRASALLHDQGRVDLEGRCLLRLAAVELDVRGQSSLACAEEAERRFVAAGQPGRRAECLAWQSRALRRLERSEAADERLRQAAELPSPDGVESVRQFVALTLALADQQTVAGDANVVATLRSVLNLLDREHLEELDARFGAHLQLALALKLAGKPDSELIHLRQVVSLVKKHDAPADLLEVRLALGTALAAAKQTDEARRVLQAVIDLARDLNDEHIRLLGLTGMTAVLADSGAVQGAVATAIQSAAGYARRGDLFGYVRGVTLAVQVLLKNGHEVPAVEMLLYGVAALEQTMGVDAAALLQLQIDALRTEWGDDRYEAVCRKLLEVRAARKRLVHA